MIRHLYIQNFLTQQERDELFDVLKAIPRHRQRAMYAGKAMVNRKTGAPISKRIIGVGSWSVTSDMRGLKAGVVNPHGKPLDAAPPEILNLADKLTKLNHDLGIHLAINYLSAIAYENERDHIAWHQHNEDRCRNATVYIVSLGETRAFGIRRVCAKHRICEVCNSGCHESGRRLCLACKRKKKQRKTCKVCKKPPTLLHPTHGSVIYLPHEYNLTHEHAVLGLGDKYGDRQPKGLRISLNTKNVRPEDADYVQREFRGQQVEAAK